MGFIFSPSFLNFPLRNFEAFETTTPPIGTYNNASTEPRTFTDVAEGFATNFDAWNPDVPHLVGLMMIFPIGKKVKKKNITYITKNSNVGLTSSDIYDLCLANQRVILDSGPMNIN